MAHLLAFQQASHETQAFVHTPGHAGTMLIEYAKPRWCSQVKWSRRISRVRRGGRDDCREEGSACRLTGTQDTLFLMHVALRIEPAILRSGWVRLRSEVRGRNLGRSSS
jgi:hypothetical protein